jgi:hypothetical protein
VFPYSFSTQHPNQQQWQTTWDRQKLFTSVGPNTAGTDPINFVSPGSIGDADIVVNDGSVFQPMYGFGGSLSGYSVYLFSIDSLTRHLTQLIHLHLH